jgi:biotin-(acetyl-CoA carboxylase) ligase
MKEDLPLKIAGVLVELFQKNNKSKQINCGRGLECCGYPTLNLSKRKPLLERNYIIIAQMFCFTRGLRRFKISNKENNILIIRIDQRVRL